MAQCWRAGARMLQRQGNIPFTYCTDFTLHITAAFAYQVSDKPGQFKQISGLEE